MKKTIQSCFKIVGLFALLILANLPFAYLTSHQHLFNEVTAWVAVLLNVLFLCGVMHWLYSYYRKLKPETVPFRLGDIGYALLWFVLGRVIAVVGTLLIQATSGQATSANDAVIFSFVGDLKNGFLPFAILFVVNIFLFAPLMEELVFRSLFIELVFKDRPKWQAWVVTSLTFAAFHLHSFAPIELLLYFALGTVCYLAYARRGDVKDSMLVHMLNNALPAIVIAWQLFS